MKTHRLRVQFLGPPGDLGPIVLTERLSRAADLEEAKLEIANVPWVDQAHACRLVDLDGRELYRRERK